MDPKAKDGQPLRNAYLDDYADPIDALLKLLRTHWFASDLAFAIIHSARDLPGVLANMKPGPGPLGYRCCGTRCEAPAMHLSGLRYEGCPSNNRE